MAKLDAADRKAIPKGDFAVPSKAPGSGAYPIEDASHARNALARSSGKPVAGQVRAAVSRKFPDIGKSKDPPDRNGLTPMSPHAKPDRTAAGRGHMGDWADKMHPKGG